MKNLLKNPEIRISSYTIIGLLVLSLVLTIWLGLDSFRIVFGSAFILFLPGFSIVYNYFKELDILEKVALSFALSIATVPLLVFFLSLIGMKITTLSTIIVVLVIVGISFGLKQIKLNR